MAWRYCFICGEQCGLEPYPTAPGLHLCHRCMGCEVVIAKLWEKISEFRSWAAELRHCEEEGAASLPHSAFDCRACQQNDERHQRAVLFEVNRKKIVEKPPK